MKKIFFLAALIFALSFTPKTFANQILPGAMLEELAGQKIESFLAERGETRRHEVTITRELTNVSLPEGIVDVQVVLPASTISYTAMTPVRAKIFVNGQWNRDINFTVRVTVFDTVLLANHDLLVSETRLTENDFTLAEIAIDGRTEFVKDVKKIVGLVPHRFVRAGSPVAEHYFRQPLAVESGHQVTIIAQRNGLRVSAQGIALVRGRIGDIIKVRNENSQKTFSAKVIDAQTVEVVF